jgi:hypothetical protein
MNKDKGICKGRCKEHKVRKPRDGTSRYLSGQVRCQICGVFMSREACHDREGRPVTDDTVVVVTAWYDQDQETSQVPSQAK